MFNVWYVQCTIWTYILQKCNRWVVGHWDFPHTQCYHGTQCCLFYYVCNGVYVCSVSVCAWMHVCSCACACVCKCVHVLCLCERVWACLRVPVCVRVDLCICVKFLLSGMRSDRIMTALIGAVIEDVDLFWNAEMKKEILRQKIVKGNKCVYIGVCRCI